MFTLSVARLSREMGASGADGFVLEVTLSVTGTGLSFFVSYLRMAA